jgi:hypothetical protein
MLSEIYMLRLEAMLRAPNAPAPGGGDPRFVPIKLSMSPLRLRSKQANKPRATEQGWRPIGVSPQQGTWIKPA